MIRVGPPVSIPVREGRGIERRQNTNRRQFGWRTVVYGFLRSRRHHTRRDGDRPERFSDWHHPGLFFLGVGVMLMSATDAFFTLRLLERGGVEINPFMRVLIDWDTLVFVSTKLSLTAFGVLVLVYANRLVLFRRLRVRMIITGFFSAYCCLVFYQYLGLLATPLI